VQSVLGKEMFRPAELVERIRRLVHGRPPVIIPALDSTFEGEDGRTERAWQEGNGPCVYAVARDQHRSARPTVAQRAS
jgi:hypothetical protein